MRPSLCSLELWTIGGESWVRVSVLAYLVVKWSFRKQGACVQATVLASKPSQRTILATRFFCPPLYYLSS